MSVPRPVVLCVLDGWGIRSRRDNNAIALANTPVWDELMAQYPHAQLEASEGFVGLPSGQMGNSEVGHMTLGSGRIVLQDLPRIDAAIADDTVRTLPAFRKFAAALKASGGKAHLLGLMSPGGVHSHQDQIAHLANILADAGIPVVVHALLDGRDTPPSSAAGYLADFQAAAPRAVIGTVTGRYYAMDRDGNWDRVSQAYAAIMSGSGEAAADVRAAIEQAQARGETDEFVRATVIDGYDGMRDGDGVVSANFRADRIREILSALLEPDFDGFARSQIVSVAAAVGMTSYSATLDNRLETLFPAESIENVIGKVVSAAHKKQLRIAETEKYAHVTFFFNGGEEAVFPGEERILVPSPKVATYDLQPEMSAPAVTDRLVAAIASGQFDFIVVNYANTDMVGHTGDLNAAIQAVQAVDACLGRLVAAVRSADGMMLVTADHGNAELMVDEDDGGAYTAHTTNPVPILVVGDAVSVSCVRNGGLGDVAPTLLDLMAVRQPPEMTGNSLIKRTGEARAAV
ncbi:MAG: 2,3-bisphosphoglycerate-independent phosphoglycerate mutase [Alphaproteobacteria bacterium]